jgi:malate synthase
MIARSGLQVHPDFVSFVENEVLPDTPITAEIFWAGMAQLASEFEPRNNELLHTRAKLQHRIDDWHRDHFDRAFDVAEYEAFLRNIGYIVPEGDTFAIETANVDPEISTIAGPQLVVPVMNARYALNAANARWGSLYDALYGTDALGTPNPGGAYNSQRGAQVIAWARELLDTAVPLVGAKHGQVTNYEVDVGALIGFVSGVSHVLSDPTAFVGHRGDATSPSSLFLKHNDLHLEIVIDRSHPIGATDPAGMCDVVLESALTAIMDFEDSVAAVDAPDKITVYRNWLGLMKGTLTEQVTKGGRTFTRSIARNKTFTGIDGKPASLRGTSLMLARNVGHLMTTSAVLQADGNEMHEGIVDALVTATCALHDLRKPAAKNSTAGSVYIVKPKMHGPEEVKFSCDLFGAVERILSLPENTLKIGIMDEERRTSVNLKECIRVAKSRVAFINTGFLDRTGDEIHTSMEAGPMVPKATMKMQGWIKSYEDRNVDIGLACGFPGKAQIGKGMWAAPDLMGDMMVQKIAHPQSGANCAWVPSPTAATLHATHYHRVSVKQRQRELAGRNEATLQQVLTIPLGNPAEWTQTEIEREVDNNAQSILGYVVRWIDQGIGCSKVPDINNVGLMEDRATCRISSQQLANWIRHGVITRDQVESSLQRMAVFVDEQNAGDVAYTPLAPNFDTIAFQSARDLITMGCEQPSGYTEPILHSRRIQRKAQQKASS